MQAPPPSLITYAHPRTKAFGFLPEIGLVVPVSKHVAIGFAFAFPVTHNQTLHSPGMNMTSNGVTTPATMTTTSDTFAFEFSSVVEYRF